MNSTASELSRPSSLVTGPIIVGVTLNWFFYGILVMQYYIYLTHAGRDKKFLQGIVHFLFLLDTAQTFMSTSDIFYCINGPLMDSVIAFAVQLVYCWRVWVLGKWRIIPVIAGLLSLVALVSGWVIGIHDLIIKTVFAIKPAYRIADYLWLTCSAAADILIAFSMTYLLLKIQRSSYTSKTTSGTIKRVLVFTLETNTVTAALATATLLFYLIKPIAPPKDNIYMTGGYLLGKAYSNCFMVLLNQRLSYEASQRSRSGNDEIGTFDGPRSWAQRSGINNNLTSRTDATPNQVEVEVSVIQFRDNRINRSSETMEMSGWVKDSPLSA